MSSIQALHTFIWKNQLLPISFVETIQVAPGVTCHVYTFDNDKNKDLGIIRIEPGSKTPLQKILKGDKTIEGYLSGQGKLSIITTDGTTKSYSVNENTKKPFEITVSIDEMMQWQADTNSELTVYEICS